MVGSKSRGYKRVQMAEKKGHRVNVTVIRRESSITLISIGRLHSLSVYWADGNMSISFTIPCRGDVRRSDTEEYGLRDRPCFGLKATRSYTLSQLVDEKRW
jgi:hypothetical protein